MTYSAEEQKANRAKWVAALRSGTYEQAQGQLRNGGFFCCLGVACEISGLGRWDENEYYTVEGKSGWGSEWASLPEPVQKWLGVGDDEGTVDASTELTLAHLNDSGATFAEIANIIESEPPGLIAEPAK